MNFKAKGEELRSEFKKLVYEYMISTSKCQAVNSGMKQSEIFRECGMDWGEKKNCTSSTQQYWIVAILRELELEEKIQRDETTKKWKLKYKSKY
jgi:hypothetical protein